MGIDGTNPLVARHFILPFADSFKESLTFSYWIITRDKIYVLIPKERKKKKQKPQKVHYNIKLVVQKFPVFAKVLLRQQIIVPAIILPTKIVLN